MVFSACSLIEHYLSDSMVEGDRLGFRGLVRGGLCIYGQRQLKTGPNGFCNVKSCEP